jgi:hypothetical protein
LALGHLASTQLDFSHRGKKRVRAGPVEDVAERADEAVERKRSSQALHKGQHRKLAGKQQCPKDQGAAQTDRVSYRQHHWPQRKAQDKDRRKGQERLSDRQAGLEQEHRREQAAKAPGQRMQACMH